MDMERWSHEQVRAYLKNRVALHRAKSAAERQRSFDMLRYVNGWLAQPPAPLTYDALLTAQDRAFLAALRIQA